MNIIMGVCLRQILCLCFCFLIFFPSNSFCAEVDSLKIYELQHRTGVELLPVLEPFFKDNSVIQADGQKILLRGNATSHQELELLLETLDTAQTPIKITIRYETLLSPTNTDNDENKNDQSKNKLNTRSLPRRTNNLFTTQNDGVSILTVSGEAVLVEDSEIRSSYRVRGGRRPSIAFRPVSAQTTHLIVATLLSENKIQISLESTRSTFDIPHNSTNRKGNQLAIKHVGALNQWLTLSEPNSSPHSHSTISTKSRGRLLIKVTRL